MMKTDIESILLANWYFTICKLENKSHFCKKTELARKYLSSKINKALFKRTEKVLENNALVVYKKN